MWSGHTMEYYLVIKGNNVLPRAATWMNLENMPSQRSEGKKSPPTVLTNEPYSAVSLVGMFIETERRLGCLMEGEWRMTANE